MRHVSIYCTCTSPHYKCKVIPHIQKYSILTFHFTLQYYLHCAFLGPQPDRVAKLSDVWIEIKGKHDRKPTEQMLREGSPSANSKEPVWDRAAVTWQMAGIIGPIIVEAEHKKIFSSWTDERENNSKCCIFTSTLKLFCVVFFFFRLC